MGNVKNKKFKSQAFNPTANASKCEKAAGDTVNEKTCSAVVKNLIQQIQSGRQEDKECACTTIANLVEQPESTIIFLKNNLVRILASLLLDPCWRVRKGALGALRNMTIGGDIEFVCGEMVKQDIMTPLVALLLQLTEEVQIHEIHQSIEISEVFNEALHILWNVCESSETALKIFNKESLHTVLLRPIKFEVPLQTTVLLTVVQCLYSVSENNRSLCQILSNELPVFHKMVTSNHKNSQELLIRINVLGIIQNVVFSTAHLPEETINEINHTTIVLLCQVLQAEVQSQLQEALVILENLKSNGALPFDGEQIIDQFSEENTVQACEVEMNENAEENTDETNKKTEEVDSDMKLPNESTAKITKELRAQQKKMIKILNEVNVQIQAQQLAVEILANICSPDDDEEWEDLDSSDGSSDEITMDSMDVTEEAVNIDEGINISKNTEQLLVENNVLLKVFSKCQPSDVELNTRLSCFKTAQPVIKSLSQLQSYSCLCLSNIISVLPEKVLTQIGPVSTDLFDNGITVLDNLWKKLSWFFTSSSTGPVNDMKENVLEALTSALRSVLERIMKLQPSMLTTLTDVDLKYLCNTVFQYKQAETRTNIIRIVGCIGCALAKETVPHFQLKGIGEFFLKVLNKESELWVIAECLDCIYDVFAEDHINDVLREIQLLEMLQKMVPMLRSKIKQQKHTLGERMVIVNETKNNLSRFIKYKMSVMK